MIDGLEHIEKLKGKISDLKSLFEKTKDSNTALINENEDLKEELRLSRQKLQELEQRYNSLKLAGAVLSSSEDSSDAKQKIDKIVREIDKCIALLNQ